VLVYTAPKLQHRVCVLTQSTFSTRHDNDNCDLTIQAVANVKPAFVWCGTQATGAVLQHFTNTMKWFVIWSDSSAVVSVHCCITIAVVCLLNTISKSSVCNNTTYAS